MADMESKEQLEKSPIFIEQYKRETTDLVISRTKYALWAACVVYPGFGLLDSVVTDDLHLPIFWAIRIAVVLGYAIALILLRYPIGRKLAVLLSVGVVFISGFGIALMIPFIGGFASGYYIGVLMALFVAGLFMPWDVKATLVCGFLIEGGYLLVNWIAVPEAATLANMAEPVFFLTGSFAFTVWANREKEMSRRRDLLQRLQLEKANEDLKALDEVKTRFFSNVSHELRSPLMLILGPIEAMLPKIADQDHRVYLEAMEANARRLLRQVNSLLDFAKMDAGKLKCQYQTGNLGQLLKDLVVAAIPLAEQRGITIKIESYEDIPDNYLDFPKVETIAANLLSNAIKFTPKEGTITVKGFFDSDKVGFDVSDTGCGIPEDQLDSVFERFRQVDDALSRKAGGTGLGLAMVKELTELHKGRVTVRSKLGQGTTFNVELPRTPEFEPLDRRRQAGRRRADQFAATRTTSMLGMYYEEKNSKRTLLSDVEAHRLEIQARTEATPKVQAPEDAPRILIVEDNPDLRTFIARGLSEKYQVATAYDGMNGLEVVGPFNPDLIMTDVMMPRMDGYTFCKKIREQKIYDKVPVILATAEWGTDKLVQGVDAGANDYISKPFEMRELEARITAHLRTRFAERELAERERRLSWIGEKTSEIVHDLRNPLNSVLGFAQLAKEEIQTRDGRSVPEYLDTVVQEAKRLGLMMTEVLEFTKGSIGTLALEETPIGPFLVTISNLQRERLKRHHIELMLDLGPEPELRVSLDPMRLRRVIENLIKNAEEAILQVKDKKEHHI